MVLPVFKEFQFLSWLMVFGCLLVPALTITINNLEGTPVASSSTPVVFQTLEPIQSGSSKESAANVSGIARPRRETSDDDGAEVSEDPETLWNEGRLPTYAWPVRYKLLFQPDLKNLALKGRATIDVEVVRKTTSLILNARDVEIERLRLFQRGLQESILATEDDVVYIEQRDQIRVRSSRPLLSGSTVVLDIKFRSKIRADVNQGVFVANYAAAKEEQSAVVLSTQFEPTFARWAFPCWDEPVFKARFQVSIVRPKKFFSVSNTPLLRTAPVNYNHYLERDDFKETYEMSVYLVAFAMTSKSAYSFVQDKAPSTVKPRIRLYAPIEQLSRGDLVLEATRGAVQYYTRLFGIPFKNLKLDLLALPQHAFGGMENVGLFTYLLRLILSDEDSSEKDKYGVVLTVTHDTSHEWIGNTATHEWFNEVWLKEGTAQFLEKLAGNAVRPDWGLIDDMYYSLNTPALRDDALAATRPLTQPVESLKSPVSLSEPYPNTIFTKGAAIWRMISSKDFFGFRVVTGGIPSLVKRYKFSNFNTEEFILELGKYTNIGKLAFKSFMETWVYQEGYPYVKVTLTGHTLTFRQRRFRSFDCAEDTAESTTNTAVTGSDTSTGVKCPNHVWQILITCKVYYEDGGAKKIQVWLKTADEETVTLDGDISYIQCNRKGTGYYRVLYSTKLLEGLLEVLKEKPTSLHRLDRASLVGDYLAFTRLIDETVPADVSFKVLQAILPKELEYVVWAVAIDELTEFYDSLRNERVKARYRLLILNLIEPAYEKIGWIDTGDHLRRRTREKILQFAVQFNQPDALKTSAKLFKEWKSYSGFTPSPNIRIAVIMGGIKALGQKAIDFVLGVYKQTTSPQVRKSILDAVSKAAGPEELERFMERTMEESQVPDVSDMDTVLYSAAYNIDNRYVATQFVCDHWDYLYNSCNSRDLGQTVERLIAGCHSSKELDYVTAFFEELEPGKIYKVRGYVKRGLQIAQLKNSWWEKHGEGMRQYLETLEDL